MASIYDVGLAREVPGEGILQQIKTLVLTPMQG